MTGEIIDFPDDEVNATRRRFLSGGAAVMAAPILPVAIMTSEGPTDPVILLIAEEYRWHSLASAARAKADKTWFAIRSGPRSPPPGLYAETDRLQTLADDLYDHIMVTPAETLAGALAKLEFAYDDDDDPEKDPDQVIVGAAIADLRRWLGARS